jgi:hypothetical protein
MRQNYLIVLLWILIMPLQSIAYTYDLALCMIFHNEALYLKEWLEFHKLVGVQHFYLYNNASTDNFRKILEPYLANCEVELIDWPAELPPELAQQPWDHQWQLPAYNDALERARTVVQWLGFLDADEFLFPVQTNNLVTFLAGYKKYGGVCINWQCFGTSGIKTLDPHKCLIEQFLFKAPASFSKHKSIKSIVQTRYAHAMQSVHTATYLPGYFHVTTHKRAFTTSQSPSTEIDKARINHYWSRDEDYFYQVKIPRRARVGDSPQACIDRMAVSNYTKDTTILRFVPALRTRLKKGEA